MKKVGVIMPKAQFPRILGDIGNPESFNLAYESVELPTGVLDQANPTPLNTLHIDQILQAALKLEASGASIITTGGGYSSVVQHHISSQLKAPFIANALSLIPMLRMLYGNHAHIGILTLDRRALRPSHFMGHFNNELKVAGLENGHSLHATITQNDNELDHNAAEQDILTATQPIIDKKVCCLLLENPSFSPYKQALQEAYDIAVYDLMDALHWLGHAKA